MRFSRKRRYIYIGLYITLVFVFLYVSGLYQYFLAQSYLYHYIHWGPEYPLQSLINEIQKGEEASIKPVNEFTFPFTYIYQEKCRSKEPIKLLYVVKSSVQNFDKRKAIRNSWGNENRFSDVVTRTVFLLGMDFSNPSLQTLVEKEANTHRDIVQAEFQDSYYNNTLKMMMGLYWTFHYCENVKYFLYVDDDYYISTRNILRFLRSPTTYPKYLEEYVAPNVFEYHEHLFAGYVFKSSSPIRWYFSKWYISLEEYPYSHWPPYVTAGAYVVSYKTLHFLYYASLYTNYFRFDDIFLGMAAKKAGLKLFHHSEFYFKYKPYALDEYKWVIASHGFDDPQRLQVVWNEQRAAGNA